MNPGNTMLTILFVAGVSAGQVPRLALVDAEVYEGTVRRIISANAVEVQGPEGTVHIRLRGVASLPGDQPEQEQAVALLSRLLLRKTVEIRALPDSEAPVLAAILAAGKNASEALLERGLTIYCAPPGGDQELLTAEAGARRRQVGIWARDATKEPWFEETRKSCRT